MPKGFKLETEEYLDKIVDLTPAVKKQKVNVNIIVNINR